MLCALSHGDDNSESTKFMHHAAEVIEFTFGGFRQVTFVLKEVVMVLLLLIIIIIILV